MASPEQALICLYDWLRACIFRSICREWPSDLRCTGPHVHGRLGVFPLAGCARSQEVQADHRPSFGRREIDLTDRADVPRDHAHTGNDTHNHAHVGTGTHDHAHAVTHDDGMFVIQREKHTDDIDPFETLQVTDFEDELAGVVETNLADKQPLAQLVAQLSTALSEGSLEDEEKEAILAGLRDAARRSSASRCCSDRCRRRFLPLATAFKPESYSNKCVRSLRFLPPYSYVFRTATSTPLDPFALRGRNEQQLYEHA